MVEVDQQQVEAYAEKRMADKTQEITVSTKQEAHATKQLTKTLSEARSAEERVKMLGRLASVLNDQIARMTAHLGWRILNDMERAEE